MLTEYRRHCQAWLKNYQRTHPAHGAFITLTDAEPTCWRWWRGRDHPARSSPMMTTFLPIAGTTGEALSALRSELAAPSGRATGQDKNQDTPQKREMRWIAPVFVNARDNDMLQAVIRSLK
ncbi:hypothetical protein [Klebsiella grimontii]|uniref:hypothetical protein n=2 Tax=Klebsiella TaxID=570 RepID=UPI00300DB810